MNGGLGICLLDQRLKEKGWDRNKLAEVTGFDFRQISFWATNSGVMSLKSAVIVANALGCAVQDLYKNGRLLVRAGT
jgi:hypothetical protein